MGYYTRYTLSVDGVDIRKTGILDVEWENGGHPYGDLFEALRDNDAVKWYEHEKDMKLLSSKYQYKLFMLYGKGEDNDDIWRKYFWNGKMQVCEAKISFDAFDMAKLR